MDKQSPPKPFFWLDREHLEDQARRDAESKRKTAQAGLVIGLFMLALAGCGIVYLYNSESAGVPDYSGSSDRWNGLCGLFLIAGLVATAVSASSLRIYRVIPNLLSWTKRLSKDDWFRVAVIVSILLAGVLIAAALRWKSAP